MSDFPTSDHVTTDDFLQPRNDGITARDSHRLALKSSSSLCSRVFLMLESVCGNHCSMGWPWNGRYRIISSTPMRWDGAHLSSAGVLKHSLLYHDKLPPLDIWWYQSDLTSRLAAQFHCGTKHNQWVLSGSSCYDKNSLTWIFKGWYLEHFLLKGHARFDWLYENKVSIYVDGYWNCISSN